MFPRNAKKLSLLSVFDLTAIFFAPRRKPRKSSILHVPTLGPYNAKTINAAIKCHDS